MKHRGEKSSIRFMGAISKVGMLIAVLALPGVSAAAAQTYEADLGPSAHDAVAKSVMTGRGTAQAVLDGNKLTISGKFWGFASPATGAHLRSGIAIGVPGPVFADLTVSPGSDGTLSGSASLNVAQLAALRTGRAYIQIDSQKVGEPYGTVWGWLLPQQEKAGEGVPQYGHWFLPQLDVPKK
jgi:hypothetical protein